MESIHDTIKKFKTAEEILFKHCKTKFPKERVISAMNDYGNQFKFLLEDHSPKGHNVTNLQYQKLRSDKQKLLELIGRMSEQIRVLTAVGCSAKNNGANGDGLARLFFTDY